MLARGLWRWPTFSAALGQRVMFDSLLDKQRERTDTKLIGRTTERWEVKQYVSTSIEAGHNNCNVNFLRPLNMFKHKA